MSVTKKKRTPKTSKGIHGAVRHPLTALERVLLGKGAAQSLQHVECQNPWRGAQAPGIPPFDKAQAAENKRLYPHLFEPERRR